MRINSAAVVLFFLIVICSQGSLSCDFLTNSFKPDACKTESFDYDIFGIAPFCRKFFNKLCDFFSNIFPMSNGIGSIFGSSIKRPISTDGSVGAGVGVSTDGARPPTGANGAGVANVRPPAVITGPLVPTGGNGVGAVSTGDSVRPPGTVGGILMEPVKPVGGSDNLRPPPVITGPLVPTGGSGAGAKPPGSVGGPIIPMIPTGGLNAVSDDDSDGIISIENDYPEVDYDAPVEGKRT